MAVSTTERKISARGGSRVRVPVKRSINLAAVTEKPINLKIAIPAILLIVIAAGLFGKFAVGDRLVAAAQASRAAASARAQLSAAYDRLESYGDIADTYGHYTLSGMTEEELGRADRVAVSNMIRSTVMSRVDLTSWAVTGNTLTLSFVGDDLDEVNSLVRTLEQDDLVSFCSVTSATAGVVDEEGRQPVTASVVVYLNSIAEGADGQ